MLAFAIITYVAMPPAVIKQATALWGPRLKAMGNRTASLLLLRTMPIKPRAPTKTRVLPGVIRKASGRPISSVSAWILVVCPPRDRVHAFQNLQ